MQFLKLCFLVETHTYIRAPLEVITRHTMINTCMPRAHSHTMAICETKQDWNEDSLMQALDYLQEKTSPWEQLQ